MREDSPVHAGLANSRATRSDLFIVGENGGKPDGVLPFAMGAAGGGVRLAGDVDDAVAMLAFPVAVKAHGDEVEHGIRGRPR